VEKLKVKLVLVDLEAQKGLATWIVGNITHANGWTRYGFNHTGVQIGPYILHFFNDGLVHFTTLKSRKPLMAITLGDIWLNNVNNNNSTLQKNSVNNSTITTQSLNSTSSNSSPNGEDLIAVVANNNQQAQQEAQQSSNTKIHQLCDLIVQYNTKKKYDSLHCNCHTFCEQVITLLGFNASIDSAFGGQLGSYLKKLKTNVMTKEYQCPFTGKVYEFKTHGELDNYVNTVALKQPSHHGHGQQQQNNENNENNSLVQQQQNSQQQPNSSNNEHQPIRYLTMREFEHRYKNDYLLLKAFDRAFWFGKWYEESFKQPDQAHVEQCKPCDCPFLDPYINSVI